MPQLVPQIYVKKKNRQIFSTILFHVYGKKLMTWEPPR